MISLAQTGSSIPGPGHKAGRVQVAPGAKAILIITVEKILDLVIWEAVFQTFLKGSLDGDQAKGSLMILAVQMEWAVMAQVAEVPVVKASRTTGVVSGKPVVELFKKARIINII